MLAKPCILSLFPNSFNKININDHSCEILYKKNSYKLKKRYLASPHGRTRDKSHILECQGVDFHLLSAIQIPSSSHYLLIPKHNTVKS